MTEFIAIHGKEGAQAVNCDEGSYQLSHTYGTTAESTTKEEHVFVHYELRGGATTEDYRYFVNVCIELSSMLN